MAQELVTLQMIVEADFLVGGKVTVCTLVLLLEQMVWVVVHMTFEKTTGAKLLSTDVARVDGQRHSIWSNDDSWGGSLRKRKKYNYEFIFLIDSKFFFYI